MLLGEYSGSYQLFLRTGCGSLAVLDVSATLSPQLSFSHFSYDSWKAVVCCLKNVFNRGYSRIFFFKCGGIC